MNRIFFLLGLLCALGASAREWVPLDGEWRFIKEDVDSPDVASDAWETVAVPHCWNALDGQNGRKANPEYRSGYYRGPAWYAREFDVSNDWKNRRVFIRFEAAFLVADVYLNGQHLGQHRGGFAAFAFELTSYLQEGENELRVRVDNSWNADIPPLSADFTMQGGIYRPVSLLITDEVCITPLYYGSPGVFIRPRIYSPGEADVEVMVDTPTPTDVTVRVEAFDAEGQCVATDECTRSIDGAATVVVPMIVNHPRLWQGRKDPYQYTVRATVLREDVAVDAVEQRFGFRTFKVNADGTFSLNGEVYPMHGVNRHQDTRDKGWALSEADHQNDIDMILDIGATCLRLAHYQQADSVIELCDDEGLLVWEEIPLVNQITANEAFSDNAKQQLNELILQHFNHPSIITWSVYNELYLRKSPPVETLVGELVVQARKLDPSRPVSGATWETKRKESNQLTEWVGFNIYPGWYYADINDMGTIATDRSDSLHGKLLAVSEYGAGGNPWQHPETKLEPPDQRSHFHPEEWQTLTHEIHWKQLRDHPRVWGTYVWAMFDFASDGRNEGGNPGVNDKGLVSQDRQTKKDAFYYYRANWNPEPMIHLTSKRWVERKESNIEVKAYSNLPEIELIVNGESQGTCAPDDVRIARWADVELCPGTNRVEVVGNSGANRLSDVGEWILELEE
ncbi:glycoside hydrolase family 2 TIM barrel-domain containing protein [Pontiellaceae bacterium B1224]|nr:glycoside hydrolase family 2 TIM barrel-domain containing protein [Pontiellaceae bacterium B1224]